MSATMWEPRHDGEKCVAQTISNLDDPKSEGRMFDIIERLRQRVTFQHRWIPEDLTRSEAIMEAVEATSIILKTVLAHGGNPQNAEPAHGPGHWGVDFYHALRLANDPEVPISAILPAMIAGSLHDIGTMAVDRFADKRRAFRHAEAGAVLVGVTACRSQALMYEDIDCTIYAIAAHTHYLRDQEVTCEDGTVRRVRPYQDTLDDGKPFLPVWLTRFADRLDVNGAQRFVGRHFLTLARDHEDYGTEGFFKVSFDKAMRPLLRTKEEIKADGGEQTMLEHMRMFAQSQNSASPYGKHDFGAMVVLRDQYRTTLEDLIDDVAKPHDVDVPRILEAWEIFLGTNIEPGEHGRRTARNLVSGFRKLDQTTQRAWVSGFETSMTAYRYWANEALAFLRSQPEEILCLPAIGDIRELIEPNQAWVEILAGRP